MNSFLTLKNPKAWRNIGGTLYTLNEEGDLLEVSDPVGVFCVDLLLKKSLTREDLLNMVLEHFEVSQVTAQKDLGEFIDSLVLKQILLTTAKG